MAEPKQPDQNSGMANLSVNSSRRSGDREDGMGNPAHQSGKRDTSESAKVPDQQMPADEATRSQDAEVRPAEK